MASAASRELPTKGVGPWTPNLNGDIYFDAGEVGIGITDPQEDLHIGGTGHPGILLEDTGNDGNRPHLTFLGNDLMILTSDDSATKALSFLSSFSSSRSFDAKLRIHGRAANSWGAWVELTHNGNDGTLRTDVGDLALFPAGNVGVGTSTPSEKLEVVGNIKLSGDIVSDNGNIGLGVTNPTERLEVDGTIRAREVIVTQQGWPDFVFARDYPLMPLEDLAARIAADGHLPDVPSAAEVAEEGVGVAEMQAVLLQKVEELTLMCCS